MSEAVNSNWVVGAGLRDATIFTLQILDLSASSSMDMCAVKHLSLPTHHNYFWARKSLLIQQGWGAGRIWARTYFLIKPHAHEDWLWARTLSFSKYSSESSQPLSLFPRLSFFLLYFDLYMRLLSFIQALNVRLLFILTFHFSSHIRSPPLDSPWICILLYSYSCEREHKFLNKRSPSLFYEFLNVKTSPSTTNSRLRLNIFPTSKRTFSPKWIYYFNIL